MIAICFGFLLASLYPHRRTKVIACKTLENFAFNSWYMLVIQSYLDLLVPSYIQLMYYNKGKLYELIVGFAVFVRSRQGVCFLMIPLTMALICWNSKSIECAGVHKSFSVLYEDFKNDLGLMSMMYFPLYMLRRVLYAFVLLFLSEYPVMLGSFCAASALLVICR